MIMEEIIPSIKHYDWAEQHPEKNICHEFSSQKEPIAELWYGTHPKGKAHIYSTGEFLDQYISSSMPYQFKLLSVGKPLSIQIHPKPDDAKILHDLNPKEFPDPVGKDEMAIALSENVILFCGFKPFKEIRNEILTYCSDLFDPIILKEMESFENIRNLLINLFEMDNSKYEILRRRQYKKRSMFRYLENFFPRDRGCAICVLFLNEIHLERFDAIFIPTGTVHCYIKGNLFECMANSDNVIRIGMSNKQKNYTAFFNHCNFTSNTPFTFNYSKTICDKSVIQYSYPSLLSLPKIQIIRGFYCKKMCNIKSLHDSKYIFILVLKGVLKIDDNIIKQGHVYICKNDIVLEQVEDDDWWIVVI